MTSLQNHPVSSAFKTAPTPVFIGVNKSMTWITSQFSRGYSRVKEISNLVRPHIFNSLNAGKTFLGSHKKWLLITATIGFAILIIDYL